MTSNPTDTLWYVYGIVPTDTALAAAPAGLDDTAVGIEVHSDVAALVSVLDGREYDPIRLETRSGDIDWVSPRAIAHDRVLTWASDRGAVVPLPMFSLFSGRDAVRAMLRERHDHVKSVFARLGGAREFALRMYRVDAELLGSIVDFSPRLQELSASARDASPGQRYLLDRKLDAEKKTEMRAVTQRVGDEVVAALEPHAHRDGVTRSPIPRLAGTEAAAERGTMVINVAFLVDPDRLEAFQKTLTALVQRYTPKGFRFDFTGPWPPYHFVSEPIA